MKSVVPFCRVILTTLLRQLPLFVFLYFVCLLPNLFGCTAGSFKHFLFRIFPQPFIYAVFLTLIAGIKNWLKYIIVFLALLSLWIELSCFFCQGSRFTSQILIILLQSNLSESQEYVGSNGVFLKLLYSILLVVISGISYWLLDKRWKDSRLLQSLISLLANFRIKAFCLIFLILIGLGVSLKMTRIVMLDEYRYYWQRISSHAPVIVPTIYFTSYNDARYEASLIDIDKLLAANKSSIVSITQSDSLDVVFVIGESHSKHRTSTYGYAKPTYPHIDSLVRKGEVIPFDNIISYSMQTRSLIPKLLSTFPVGQPFEKYSDYPLLPVLMKKAGYKTALYSDQSLVGTSENFDFGCYYFLSNKDIVDMAFDDTNQTIFNYDGDLVNNCPPLHHGDRNFTIYHLIGQHTYAAERVPDSFPKPFKKDYYSALTQFTSSQPLNMADYDNACVYNDYVLNQIISRLSGRNAIMVYVSDHGDENYDWRDHAGRIIDCHLTGTVKVVHELPMYIWMSPEFIARNGAIVDSLKNNVDKPIYNTDISHTILEIAGVESPSVMSKYSLLNSDIPRKSRRIGSRLQFNYDSMKAEIDSFKLIYDK